MKSMQDYLVGDIRGVKGFNCFSCEWLRELDCRE